MSEAALLQFSSCGAAAPALMSPLSRRLHPANLLKDLLAQQHSGAGWRWHSQQRRQSADTSPNRIAAAGAAAAPSVVYPGPSPPPTPPASSSPELLAPSAAAAAAVAAAVAAAASAASARPSAASAPASTLTSSLVLHQPQPQSQHQPTPATARRRRKRPSSASADADSDSEKRRQQQQQLEQTEKQEADATMASAGSKVSAPPQSELLRVSSAPIGVVLPPATALPPSTVAISATVLSAASFPTRHSLHTSSSATTRPLPASSASPSALPVIQSAARTDAVVLSSESSVSAVPPPPVVVRSYAKLNNLLCCRHVCGCVRSKFDCRKLMPPQLEQHLKEQHRDKCIRDCMRQHKVSREEAVRQVGSMDYLAHVAVIKRASRQQHEQNAALHRCGQPDNGSQHFACSQLLKHARLNADKAARNGGVETSASVSEAVDTEREPDQADEMVVEFEAALSPPPFEASASESESVAPETPPSDAHEQTAAESRTLLERLFVRATLSCLAAATAARNDIRTAVSGSDAVANDSGTERVVLLNDEALRSIHTAGVPLPFVDHSPDPAFPFQQSVSDTSVDAILHSPPRSANHWSTPALYERRALVHVSDVDSRFLAGVSAGLGGCEHDNNNKQNGDDTASTTAADVPFAGVRDVLRRLASAPQPYSVACLSASPPVPAVASPLSRSTVQIQYITDLPPPPRPSHTPHTTGTSSAAADTFDLFRLARSCQGALADRYAVQSWAERRVTHGVADHRPLTAASPFFATTVHTVESGRMAWMSVDADQSAEQIVQSFLESRCAAAAADWLAEVVCASLPTSTSTLATSAATSASPLLFLAHAGAVLMDPLLFALNSVQVQLVLQGDGQSAPLQHTSRSMVCAAVLGSQPCVVLERPLLPAKEWLQHGLPSCERWLEWAAAALPLTRPASALRAAGVAAVRRLFPQPLSCQLFTAIARQVAQTEWSISLTLEDRLSAAGRLLRCCTLRERLDDIIAQQQQQQQ